MTNNIFKSTTGLEGYDANTYDVGYKKPPMHSRFQPGRSGNPHGRPKGAKGIYTVLEKAVRESVTIQKNGKPRKVSKLEVAITQVVNKAAQGDTKALQLLIPHLRELETKSDNQAQNYTMSGTDMDVLRNLNKFYQSENSN